VSVRHKEKPNTELNRQKVVESHAYLININHKRDNEFKRRVILLIFKLHQEHVIMCEDFSQTESTDISYVIASITH